MMIEFGKTLTNEVRLDPMLSSVMDRVSQTLLVDRLAIFVEDEEAPGKMRLARSMGVRVNGPLDFSFLEPARPDMKIGRAHVWNPVKHGRRIPACACKKARRSRAER